MELSSLAVRLHALSVLRGMQAHPLIQACMDTLDALQTDVNRFADCYGSLCRQLFACKDASRALLDGIHFDVNPLNRSDTPSPVVLRAATQDLTTLNAFLALDGKTILTAADEVFCCPALLSLPGFPASAPLPFADGPALLDYYQKAGYGFFARSTAFSMQEDGALSPVACPDPVSLRDLPGYVRQKKQILQNTRAFLSGHAANNILLYGDKGTGKSSTIKAVVNEYAAHGLKIIELPPRHIIRYPQIFAETQRSPFRFILFLDDLSFRQEDDNFAALKAFIEGGLTGKPSNLIIYATSNRRHLIRESMADRQGDEVRTRDTLETVTSLSDRFGLEITFSVPDRDEYLYIVDEIARENKITLPENDLHLLAERFALRRNGRSPRTARQFISQMLTEQFETT